MKNSDRDLISISEDLELIFKQRCLSVVATEHHAAEVVCHNKS